MVLKMQQTVNDALARQRQSEAERDENPLSGHVVEQNGKRYKEYPSPHNPEAVMMRLPVIDKPRDKVLWADKSGRGHYEYPAPSVSDKAILEFGATPLKPESAGKIRTPAPPPPPPSMPREPIVDYGPTLSERFMGLFKGPITKALEKDLADENSKQAILSEIDSQVEEKKRAATQAEIARQADLLDPAKIKIAADALPDAAPHEIMQWGWEAEKMFARRQDEIHDDYIKGGVKAKSHTGEVTSRIKKSVSKQRAGWLKRIWLRVAKEMDDIKIVPDLNADVSRFDALLSPRVRMVKTLGFIADLERAVENDITIAQDQIGFCSRSSLEMDQFYQAIRTYERELKKNRGAIIEATRAKSEDRFDEDDSVMRQMHEREVLDAGKNVDERLDYLSVAVEKCRGEYGVYVSAMEHEKLAIDALQTLMRQRLPHLEAQVKRGLKIIEAQEAMKARGARRAIDVKIDLALELTPEQAENELKSIAAQVTLQIEAVEKLHAAIIHDESLVIEGKEPTTLIEYKPVLMLPAPSKITL